MRPGCGVVAAPTVCTVAMRRAPPRYKVTITVFISAVYALREKLII